MAGIHAEGKATAVQPPPLPWKDEASGLKIVDVRVVKTKPATPREAYTPPKSPSGLEYQGHGVVGPMSVYEQYRGARSSYYPNKPGLDYFTVEITTDKGIKGYGLGGTGGALVVESHLARLLMNEDPFNVDRIWDIMYRGTMHYSGGRGIAINAISGVDCALWDIIGKATNLPVYKLLGGKHQDSVPCYAHGPGLYEVYLKMGFKHLKISMPYGPASGVEGMRKNVALVKHFRSLLGPDGRLGADCWMGWTETYTMQMAELLGPYNVMWLEEVLPPYDYAGYGRCREKIKPMLLNSGEHEYTRYGFREMLEHRSADIWNPDLEWTGGVTEVRRISALAQAYDIPMIMHGGADHGKVHVTMAVNSPMAEMFGAVPTKQYEDEHFITRGPEGIYTRPSEKPGFGWNFIVA
ncbi:MAG: enolase C-terminal domain-like protein [Deltaproteobacteria bacterium]|nr:enolase C-terminal domain-like protein [Deltaproteobacteria bacterium]